VRKVDLIILIAYYQINLSEYVIYRDLRVYDLRVKLRLLIVVYYPISDTNCKSIILRMRL